MGEGKEGGNEEGVKDGEVATDNISATVTDGN